MAKNRNQEPKKTAENSGNAAKNDMIKAPDVVDNLESMCLDIAQEYINNLEDPAEIKEKNGLFVDMLKYIYDTYLIYILDNNKGVNNRYDYKVLDKIFKIYTRLVYRYKKNNRPNILEFTVFIRINRQSLYNAVYNNTQKLTNDDIQIVKTWFTECENSLVNGSSVFEIFLLKSQYRYNDNLSPIPLENQAPALAVNELPDLSTCQSVISDNQTPNNTSAKHEKS